MTLVTWSRVFHQGCHPFTSLTYYHLARDYQLMPNTSPEPTLVMDCLLSVVLQQTWLCQQPQYTTNTQWLTITTR